jgi:hypothetical protein
VQVTVAPFVGTVTVIVPSRPPLWPASNAVFADQGEPEEAVVETVQLPLTLVQPLYARLVSVPVPDEFVEPANVDPVHVTVPSELLVSVVLPTLEPLTEPV